MKEEIEARFWPKVDKSGDCWVWTASKFADGYGQFGISKMRKSNFRAHRVSWWIAYGEWPAEDMDLCHKCDNPACVRPDHLFVGDRTTNMRDASAKGRVQHGVGHWGAKLTEADVLAIRGLRAIGESYGAISRKYGVAMQTVARICQGVRWRHLNAS